MGIGAGIPYRPLPLPMAVPLIALESGPRSFSLPLPLSAEGSPTVDFSRLCDSRDDEVSTLRSLGLPPPSPPFISSSSVGSLDRAGRGMPTTIVC